MSWVENSQPHAARLTQFSKRWCQFGLLSSHSRLHGSGSPRVPWTIDDEACQILSTYTKLKNRLEPYLTSQSIIGVVNNGLPMMRAMFIEFPEDRSAWMVDEQYMLGESLLVAPVFGESDVEYYLPAGIWTNILTGTGVTGPGWIKESHAMSSLPLLLRPGSAIIIGKSGHLVSDSILDRGFTVIISRHCVEKIRVESAIRGEGSRPVSVTITPTMISGVVKSYTVTCDVQRLAFEVVIIGEGRHGLLKTELEGKPSENGTCEIVL